MSQPTTVTRTEAQATADRLIAKAGPLPDHHIQSIARRLRKAAERDTGHPDKKPA